MQSQLIAHSYKLLRDWLEISHVTGGAGCDWMRGSHVMRDREIARTRVARQIK